MPNTCSAVKKKKRTKKPDIVRRYAVGRHEGEGVYDLEGCNFYPRLSGAITDLAVRSAQMEETQDMAFHLQLLEVDVDENFSVHGYRPVPVGMFVQWMFSAGWISRKTFAV